MSIHATVASAEWFGGWFPFGDILRMRLGRLMLEDSSPFCVIYVGCG